MHVYNSSITTHTYVFLHIPKKAPKSLRNCTPAKYNCSFSLLFFIYSVNMMKMDKRLTAILDEKIDNVEDLQAKYQLVKELNSCFKNVQRCKSTKKTQQ